MKENSIGDSEYKLMELIWEYAPVASGELSTMCEMIHGWNDEGIERIKAGIQKVYGKKGPEIVEKNFKGSLPMFVNAFLGGGKKMSKEDAQSLIDMIEQHTEE